MNERFLVGILIFGIIQSLFFALLFSTKGGKSLPDKLLGVWLLVFALQTFLIVMNLQNPAITILPLLMTLLYGPILFLYVSRLTFAKSKLSSIDFVHLLPFVLFFLLSFLFPTNSHVFIKLLGGASALLGIAYCAITFYLLRKHKKNITNRFSNIEKISLAWLNKLVVGLLFIWSGVFILVAFYRFLNIELPLNWFFTIIPFFIFYIGYYGHKQQVIYTHVRESDHDRLIEIQENQKSYKKSGLQPDTMKAIHDKLLGCMQKEKLYLNQTLSLTDLSEKMNIPAHHITQTLNEYAKINFYDFINGFRVDAVIGKIESEGYEKYSLLGIAFDCGFNSKSSFNRIFKNFTGTSPSEYKKRKSPNKI